MTTSRFAHRCAALLISAFLAACSGGSQLAPQGPMQRSAAQSYLKANAGYASPDNSPPSGEVFTASNVTVRHKNCSGSHPPHTTHLSASEATRGDIAVVIGAI